MPQAFTFVHSSDLHLGKPFGRFPEDVRVRLRQARADTLATLAEVARAHGAGHILLAGDTFDQTTPAPKVIRQALNQMRAQKDVIWVVMPGNHDHANATELWAQIARDKPDNVIVADAPSPIALAQDVVVLPAPPFERHPGRDLTDWFDGADTGTAIRIGLAHGSVTDFDSSEEGGSSVIAPDRAARAGLAYLALGDWHGQLEVGARSAYSGAPESDGFKHSHAPVALVVTVESNAALPRITPVCTSKINWLRCDFDVTGHADALAALAALMPPLAQRAQVLMDLRLSGRIRAPQRVALEQAVAQIAPDFLWHRADFSALGLLPDTADLDVLDSHGALRAAAQTLADAAQDPAHSQEACAEAEAALSLLFSFAMET
ncbi:exonuclease subunit SbcD [Aquimixticola soesokkakensis]|uniref:Exonuclease subunit SbcD n=1 Tax=Aquimixticola soesokkakensis TaxID=1519096 RepID=A0A1Y5TAW1_9RHOB|nr:metallophosphoesterase [Aquimixticola soesokkakensis]SLN56235.1 exonuclease subunit SbcD [Aquimixticola soesokkakensis]